VDSSVDVLSALLLGRRAALYPGHLHFMMKTLWPTARCMAIFRPLATFLLATLLDVATALPYTAISPQTGNRVA
jgi:hypothetical protein